MEQASAVIAPPKHLSKEAKQLWSDILEDYDLESHHLKLLQSMCEVWDRIVEARERVKKDGAYYTDRFDQPREHPALKIEKDNRILLARLLRKLNLDLEVSDGPRPPRLYK